MTPKELYDWAMALANMPEGCNSKYNGTKLRIESSGQEVVYLDNGAFGTVFEHRECPGVVVKVSQMSDGYLAFATYAKVNPAPCFPTVYECGYDNSASVCITVMEKLDCTANYAGCHDYQFLADDLRQVWKGTRRVSPLTEAWQYWPQLQAMAEFFGDSVGYDLHGSNWMMRGGQLVLTDPFAGTYGTTPQELTTRVKQHKPFRPPVVEQIEMDFGPALLDPVRNEMGAGAVDKAAAEIPGGVAC